MNRRHFLHLVFYLPAFLYLRSEPLSAAEASPRCGICGSSAVFDNFVDINLCPVCGARETSVGWEKP
jgi:rubredoxin